MAAFAGLLNRQMTAAQALTGKSADPMAAPMSATGGTAGTGGSSSSSATISSNDFLTLLVTEMQNQDPTANVDPNEYISQLVQVNSLEQLISINQNLTTALGTSGSPSSGSSQATAGKIAAPTSSLSAATPAATIAPNAAAKHASGALVRAHAGVAHATGSSSTVAAISQFAKSIRPQQAPGNLSVPEAKASAHRVAHALDGHTRAKAIPGNLPGTK